MGWFRLFVWGFAFAFALPQGWAQGRLVSHQLVGFATGTTPLEAQSESQEDALHDAREHIYLAVSATVAPHCPIYNISISDNPVQMDEIETQSGQANVILAPDWRLACQAYYRTDTDTDDCDGHGQASLELAKRRSYWASTRALLTFFVDVECLP